MDNLSHEMDNSIGFVHGTKYFKTPNGIQVVLNDATFLVGKGEKIGILGNIGSGKSTIIKILAGMQKLNSGLFIKRSAWPLGYAGGFHPYLTANENIKITAQLNALDPISLRVYCQDFAELSTAEMNLKMSAYSANMRAKLGFALSLTIPCEFFLADDKLSVGDEDFRVKCEVALELRLENTGLIFFSRNPKLTQNVCEQHAILHHGQIQRCKSHEEACRYFEELGSIDHSLA